MSYEENSESDHFQNWSGFDGNYTNLTYDLNKAVRVIDAEDDGSTFDIDASERIQDFHILETPKIPTDSVICDSQYNNSSDQNSCSEKREKTSDVNSVQSCEPQLLTVHSAVIANSHFVSGPIISDSFQTQVEDSRTETHSEISITNLR